MPRLKADTAQYSAPALEKGLDILELLADAPSGLTQNQIAGALERSASELFRMLEVLVRRGFVTRSPGDGSYRLSLRMFELAHRQEPVRRLLAVALPHMRELARVTRQSNHLVVHHDRRILVLAQTDSPEAMGFSVRQGAHFPFWADRVSSRVLTAFQSPARREELIAEMRRDDPRAPPAATLRRQVATIAGRGYEERISDTTPGIIDLCFPIFDHSGFAIATLTQPYLRQRDVVRSVAEAREAQAKAARAISRELGARLPVSTSPVSGKAPSHINASRTRH